MKYAYLVLIVTFLFIFTFSVTLIFLHLGYRRALRRRMREELRAVARRYEANQ